MSDHISDITWTNRSEVCDRLAAFVRANPPGEPQLELMPDHPFGSEVYHRIEEQRERVIAVLARLADVTHASTLCAVLIDPNELETVRRCALDALYRMQARLPMANLQQLNEDVWYFDDAGDIARFLLLFQRGEALPEPVRSFLDQRIQPSRSQILVEWLREPERVPASWLDWLYERWLGGDCASLEQNWDEGWVRGRAVSIDLLVASLSRDRPDSEALIQEYRRRPSEQVHRYIRLAGTPLWPEGWESAPPELWSSVDELAQAVAAEPEAFIARLAELDLPYDGLVQYLSPDSLLSRVEEQLRGGRLDQIAAFQTADWRALELLRRWPDDACDEVLSSLYLCPDTSSYLCSKLYNVMWSRGWERLPEMMRSGVRNWPAQDRDQTEKGQALLRLAADPQEDDREFFLWATNVAEKPEFRYQAILALEALGENSETWQTRLCELSADADPTVSVAAAGALLSLGDRSQLGVLIQASESEPDTHTRAEAIRRLGELDAEAHLTTLANILFEATDSPHWGSQPRLAPVEAAYWLASLATPEALTALLRGCLAAQDHGSRITRLDYLQQASQRLEGAQVPLTAEHRDWRLTRPWEWRCCGGP